MAGMSSNGGSVALVLACGLLVGLGCDGDATPPGGGTTSATGGAESGEGGDGGGRVGSSGGTSSGGQASGGSSSTGSTRGGASSSTSGGVSSGGETAGGASGGGGTGGATSGGGDGSGGAAPSGSLSERYPGDEGLASDPAVIFHDDFESGWGKWDAPSADTEYLHLETDEQAAHAGAGYLRSTVTTAHLEAEEYISSSTRLTWEPRVDEVYWRFHARFPELAPNPHHWIRMAAGDDQYSSSGRANTVPPGDEGFWFDFDASNDDAFNFYVYWYNMRSGRCNDGSATDGCEGDQGTTYYYGNVFQPPDQAPFPRDRWFCVEIHAKANTVGESDGELSFWVDDELIGDYRPGFPDGTWLRAQFHTGGCDFSACTEPVPFEGFDFRSSDAVAFKSIFLDAYYERGSSADKRAALEDRGLTLSDAQTVLYDDVVVATQRIGCRR